MIAEKEGEDETDPITVSSYTIALGAVDTEILPSKFWCSIKYSDAL